MPATLSESAIETPRHALAEPLGFALAAWGASRLLIALAWLAIAPHLPIPPGGHPVAIGGGLFTPWDGSWYLGIAERGYEFALDGRQHSLAFFPLFPLLIRLGTLLGLPAAAAGALISNLSALGALFLLYHWAAERFDRGVARWAVALLALSPHAVFTSLVYTEGLFLLLTAIALWAFDRRQHALAALAGALATATRVTALPLAPAMALVAWRERRPWPAYGAAAASLLGVVGFAGYCAVAFGHPLAFLTAQQGWRSALGFDFTGWVSVFSFGTLAPPIWNGTLIGVMLLGGAVLVLNQRRALPPVAFWFALGGLGLIALSGSTTSVDRYVYGLLPMSLALGLLLARHPRWGVGVLVFSLLTLLSYTIRLAQGLWVA